MLQDGPRWPNKPQHKPNMAQHSPKLASKLGPSWSQVGLKIDSKTMSNKALKKDGILEASGGDVGAQIPPINREMRPGGSMRVNLSSGLTSS